MKPRFKPSLRLKHPLILSLPSSVSNSTKTIELPNTIRYFLKHGKKLSAQQLKPCQRRETVKKFDLGPIKTQNNPFNFATTLICHQNLSIIDGQSQVPRIRIDRQFIKHEPPFRRVLRQVQFAFQCRDSRTNSRRIVAVSLEPARTRPF